MGYSWGTEVPAVPEPVRAAAELGRHSFTGDPPAALTSMRRWTCATCGRAVLVRPDDTGYGSATTEPCTPATERGDPGFFTDSDGQPYWPKGTP